MSLQPVLHTGVHTIFNERPTDGVWVVVKMWANEADHLTQKGVVFYREIADNALRSLLDEYSGQPIQ
jgi:hypothetical protein